MRFARAFRAGAVAALALIFMLRCHATYRVFNDTKDEAVHIASGLEMWHTRRCTIDVQHPPLARMLLGLAARWGGLRDRGPRGLWTAGNTDFYWHTLSAARMGNLVFAPLLLAFVYVWGSRLYGPGAGVLAAALASLSPNLLAHASLATVDFGAATTGFIAMYYFWRWSRAGGWGACLKAAAAFALAVLTKFSALAFVPAAGILFFLTGRRGRGAQPGRARRRTMALRGAMFLAVFLLVVWGGYLFEAGPLRPPVFFAPPGSLAQRAISRVERLAGHRRIPAPALARGILSVAAKNAAGHPCYLFGHVRQSGWWYYFPAALLLKTTLPLLLLVVLGAGVGALAARQGKTAPIEPALAAAMILLIAMTSTLDLGIRYILVMEPLLALIAAGGALRPRARLAIAGLAGALAVWHAAESATAGPDYLAYFNPIARGREERFLLDSNLDWGQDLERLHRYLAAHHINSIYLSYFGFTDPAWLGMSGVKPLWHGPPPDGWAAVSKNHIGGIGRHASDLAWTRGRIPAARIGKSILLYDCGQAPAAR